MSAAALRAPAVGPHPLTPAALLHAVRELLGRPSTWRPGGHLLALDCAGLEVACRSPTAARFGLLAALMAFTGPEEVRQHAIACLVAAGAKPTLLGWEGDPTRIEAEVLALIGAAITLAARGGP